MPLCYSNFLDYSEGYENGETDCGVAYDDTLYYGPSTEAVFTDPNTGQVFYGKDFLNVYPCFCLVKFMYIFGFYQSEV